MAPVPAPAGGLLDEAPDAVARQVRRLLSEAPLTPVYRRALVTLLSQPGGILSAAPRATWARMVCACCTAAGGTWACAVPIAAVGEVFMAALDLLDDIEDGEGPALHGMARGACALNASTGLLLLAQRGSLGAGLPEAATILLDAGLVACAGQHEDLSRVVGPDVRMDDALAVTAGKSAALVATLCRLGARAARAPAPVQNLYARFGMALQLANDAAAAASDEKTDAVLGRPTLPLVYNAWMDRKGDRPARPLDGRSPGVALTWTIANTYRRRALSLVAELTADATARAILQAVVPTL